MPRMPDQEIVAAAAAAVTGSANWLNGTLARQRETALRYYRGDPFGNEIEGRSQVVSRDVAQYIDTVMPSLMRIFGGSDEIVRFEPTQQADEEQAQQATDYINWIWTQQNNGFMVFHDWFKDGLLNKLGTVKIWWDDSPERVREVYRGLTQEELTALGDDPDIEIGEVTPAVVPVPGTDGQITMMPAFDAVVTEINRIGRVCVSPVPSEEFIFGRRAKSDADAGVLGHRTMKTRTQLLEDGYDEDTVDGLFTGDQGDLLGEVTARFEDVDDSPHRTASDRSPADNEIEVVEAYMRLDVDGDGRTEYVKVCYSGTTLLDVEEVDDHPFANVTPIPMPHRMVGLSMADQTMDIQLTKSTIWRQMLDNLYLVNMPQVEAVVDQVNVDDLIKRRPGGVVRVKSPGMMKPLVTPPLGQEPYRMIEYLDTTAEQRTGATRYNQGLDANTLNKTATGINLIQNAAAQRIEMIARVYAETGVKRVFRRILQLVCKHQQKARVIRMRGKWVEMDPRAWKDSMDMTVTVGLGTGNRDQIMAHLMTLLNVDMQIVDRQGGVQGPLVTVDNIYNKLRKITEAAGLKGDGFYTDPSSPEAQQRMAAQQQQPQEPPEAVKAKMQLAVDQQRNAATIAMQREKQTADIALAREKAEAELALKAWQAEQDAAMRDREMQARADMERVTQAADHEARLTDTLTKRQVEMQSQAVQPIDAKVTQLGERVEEALNGTLAALQDFAQRADAIGQRIEEIAADMSAPRELVRGADGRATGVRVGNRERAIVRGDDGRAVGLQ